MVDKKGKLIITFIILTILLSACNNDKDDLNKELDNNNQLNNEKALVFENDIKSRIEKIIAIHYILPVNNNTELHSIIYGDDNLIDGLEVIIANSLTPHANYIIKNISELNKSEVETLAKRTFFNNGKSIEEVVTKHNLKDYTVLQVLVDKKWIKDEIYQECEDYFIIGNKDGEIKIYGTHVALIN